MEEEIYQRKELAYRCLIDAARSLSGAADIDALVGQILSSSRDVMQCWACSVSLPDPETGDLIIRGTQAELKGQVLRNAKSACGGCVGMVNAKSP